MRAPRIGSNIHHPADAFIVAVNLLVSGMIEPRQDVTSHFNVLNMIAALRQASLNCLLNNFKVNANSSHESNYELIALCFV